MSGWDFKHYDVDGKLYTTSGTITASDVAVEAANLDKLLNGVAADVLSQLEAIDEFSFDDFVSRALIADQKDYNVAGGTFTSGAWRTRDLNTELYDPDAIVSISSNQFSLAAGTYRVRWWAMAHDHVNQTVSKLYNATDAADVATGTPTYISNNTLSHGVTEVTIAGTKAFEIQHYSQATQASSGFGTPHNLSGYYNYYTVVEIWQVA